MKRMLKNKRGQQIFVGIMAALLVFIALVQLITPLKTVITQARSDLSCGTAGLSVGTQATCVLVDWYMPYFLVAGIAVSIAFVTQKKFVTVSQ